MLPKADLGSGITDKTATHRGFSRVSAFCQIRPGLIFSEQAGAVEKLNQWLTLLANVGVLLGIAFLAFEVQQNTTAIQSQTRATVFSGVQEELWKNMEYTDVTLNMLSSRQNLSPEEKVRFDAWMMASMKAREFAWLEFRSGNFDPIQWEQEQIVISLVLGCSRCRDWWKKLGRLGFNPEFVAITDNLIDGTPEVSWAERVLSIE